MNTHLTREFCRLLPLSKLDHVVCKVNNPELVGLCKPVRTSRGIIAGRLSPEQDLEQLKQTLNNCTF